MAKVSDMERNMQRMDMSVGWGPCTLDARERKHPIRFREWTPKESSHFNNTQLRRIQGGNNVRN
jgi:hypothetical protein